MNPSFECEMMSDSFKLPKNILKFLGNNYPGLFGKPDPGITFEQLKQWRAKIYPDENHVELESSVDALFVALNVPDELDFIPAHIFLPYLEEMWRAYPRHLQEELDALGFREFIKIVRNPYDLFSPKYRAFYWLEKTIPKFPDQVLSTICDFTSDDAPIRDERTRDDVSRFFNDYPMIYVRTNF